MYLIITYAASSKNPGARVCPLIEPIELAKKFDSTKYNTIQITRAYEIRLAFHTVIEYFNGYVHR